MNAVVSRIDRFGQHHTVTKAWNMEREARHIEANRPNPEHVAHLRAGIAEFRRLLRARD